MNYEAYLRKMELEIPTANEDELRECLKELIGILKQHEKRIKELEDDMQHMWTYAEGVR